MKFLVDNQLPIHLAVHLKSRGHDSSHVVDFGWDELSDVELWTRAVAGGWVLVSKDEDFVFLANRPGDSGKLVWVRLGNCRNPALLAAFEFAHHSIMAALTSGQRIVEIR